jgi:hypothetical protein
MLVFRWPWCSSQCLDLHSGRTASCTSWGHQQENCESPSAVYGDQALEVPAVHDRCSRVTKCRPSASRNDDNVVKVRTVVTSDRSVTVGQTKNEVWVSYRSFKIIVEDELLVWWVCAKWSCHTWIAVQQFLVKIQIQTIPQPPFCPDLASCNFRPSQDTTELKRILSCVIRRNSREHKSGTHGRTEGGLAERLPGRSGPLKLVCVCMCVCAEGQYFEGD